MTMETLVQLGHQYKSEFEDRYEGIRKRGLEQLEEVQNKIQQVQPELVSKQEEFVNLVQDLSPVQSGYTTRIIEAFAWTSVLLFAYYASSLVSGIVLAPLVGLFIGGAAAFLIAYFALPAAVFYYKDLININNEDISDQDTRFQLLAFAAVEGVLTGYLFSERYLSTIQPLIFIAPLLIAVVGGLVEEKIGTSRLPILGSTLGAGVAFHVLFGLIGGQLSFSYLLLTLLYAGIGFATLQFLFKDGDYSQGKACLCMFAYLVAAIYAQLVVFFIFGGAKEAVQKPQPSEPIAP